MNVPNKRFKSSAAFFVAFFLCLFASAVFAQPAPPVTTMILKPNCPDQGSSFDNTSFGCREAKMTKTGVKYSSNHKGEDFRCPSGTSMGALMTAPVSCYPNAPGNRNGNYCTQTADCMTLLYLHLNDYIPSTGRKVNQGEFIGHTGQSYNGSPTGVAPHLHLHIKIGNIAISPQYYYWKYGGRNICNDPVARKDLTDNAAFEAKNCPGSPTYTRAFDWGVGGSGGAPMPDMQLTDPETVDEADACQVID